MYICVYFFFNDTATTEIYTLSLHDALPIYQRRPAAALADGARPRGGRCRRGGRAGGERPGARRSGGLRVRAVLRPLRDRKSTRLNSSHANISYAVFCLKKKTTIHFIASNSS